MTYPIIEVNHISKKYRLGGKRIHDTLRDTIANLGQRQDLEVNEFWALNDVSFTVNKGEVVGIIGINGSGKSTLLKILSRITPPTIGEVILTGRVASLLEVGTGFSPELTGRENIFLNGAILGMTQKEIRNKYNSIVEFSGVNEFIDTPVKRYSSGMYVRLAFAVAAHLDPEILLIDEVLAVGDSIFQKKCLQKIESLVKNDGKTVVFISHNLETVRSLCQRTILLDRGKITAEGKTSEVVAKYQGQGLAALKGISYGKKETLPRNSKVEVVRVSLCDEKNNALDEVSTDTVFRVCLDYKVKIEGAKIGFTLVVRDREGKQIFSSISNNDKELHGKPLKIGKYRTYCEVPGDLFNNIWVNLGINLYEYGYVNPRYSSEILSFEIADGSSVRRDFFGRYEGPFRPDLKWQTEKF